MWIPKNGVSRDFYDPEDLQMFLEGLQNQTQSMDTVTLLQTQDQGQVLQAEAMHTQIADRDKSYSPLKPTVTPTLGQGNAVFQGRLATGGCGVPREVAEALLLRRRRDEYLPLYYRRRFVLQLACILTGPTTTLLSCLALIWFVQVCSVIYLNDLFDRIR
ncbi:hypothetical protein NDU88_003671 [Pleurodeles waltl]|uniref:Uncharacterized protein n=1 Tax=Pleurodeles waltl TaxID=8319 RepID=A0AAV7T5R4_PLEWA|nr:hypothetical protein NDU88_003671 [Pleurodeles waltl]